VEQIAQIEFIMVLLIGSIILSAVLAWLSIKLAPEVGLMDIPGSAEHKNHDKSMPLVGGIVLIDTLIVMMLVTGMWRQPGIWAISVSGLVIGLFGLVDDLIHLNATKKLIGQIVASVILIGLGVQVNFFDSPEFLFQIGSPYDKWLNILFTILWIITVTNAFNFIDSMDGLAVGLSGVSAGFILMMALLTGQTDLIFLTTVILGVCIVLYIYNSHPASLFLGDSGAQLFGFLLAASAIYYNPKVGTQASSWFVPVLLFAVPLFDMVLVIFSRLRRGKKIHKASKDHTYHRLEQRGIPIHHAVLLMHSVSLILSMVGFLCLNLPPVFANSIFGLVILLGVATYLELDKRYF